MIKLINDALECARLQTMISNEISKGMFMNVDFIIHLKGKLSILLNKQ